MAWWNRNKTEVRANLENPTVPISNENIVKFMGLDALSDSDVNVDVDSALGVPAIWAAVNFISSTIAGLPLHVYKKTKEGREKVSGGIKAILHDAPNEELTSFDWRKSKMEQVLTQGRGLTFIERNAMGRIINLWPLQLSDIKIRRKNGRKLYESKSTRKVYEARDIIDLAFMLDSDLLSHISPILKNKDAIGLAISATKYGSKHFQNGGVPPFSVTGNFQSSGAMKRASNDLEDAVRKASKEKRLALTLPMGLEIKPLGSDPEKSQLLELKRFCVEEVARIYSLPPTFLQDLSNGTFSNTEQEDLRVAKHTARRWIVQFEQELNLKIFGRNSHQQYVEFNVDGLLRGDFASRMDGLAKGIQNALITPNEAREIENRPKIGNANDLLIQGATVPLGAQPNNQGVTDD